jgi:hypothetical protein
MKNVTNLRMAAVLTMVSLLGVTTLSASTVGATLGDVVVDGVSMAFGSDDVISNLTVINGGIANLNGSTVEGNIKIEGAQSYAGLSWVSVGGNVKVGEQAFLSVGYSTVAGNFKGDGYYHINFGATEVFGSVVLVGGGAFNALYGGMVGGDFKYTTGNAVNLNYFTFGGNVSVVNNYGPGSYEYVWIRNCEILGNLKVSDNDMGEAQYPYSGIAIENNTVGGNLNCTKNTPTPVVSGNDVQGDVKVD